MKKGIFMLAGTPGFFSVLSFFSVCVFVPASASYTDVSTSRVYAGGSAQVIPLGFSSSYLQARYPGILTPALLISNERYDNLPVCPTSPLCPDINGNQPIGYTSTTCPPSCVVTRTVTPTPTQPPAQPLPITSTKDAVCPVSYIAVATYRADKEIKYGPMGTTAPFPIPDKATYDTYVNSFYNCLPVQKDSGTVSYLRDYCGAPDSMWKLDEAMLISNTVAKYNNKIGKYIYRYSTSCYPTSNCKSANSWPAPCTKDAPFAAATYIYAYMECSPPIGLSYTTYTVPTSIVCSHLTPTWQ